MGNKCGCSTKENQMMDDLDQRDLKPKSRKNKANRKSDHIQNTPNSSMDPGAFNRTMTDASLADTYANPTMKSSMVMSELDFDKKMQFGEGADCEYSPEINLHRDPLTQFLKFDGEDPEILRSLQAMQV